MNLARAFWMPAAMVGLTAIAVAQYADAGAGTVKLGRTAMQESNNAWRLRASITLPKAPSTARPPFKFSFTPVTVFERTVVEGNRTEETRRPVHNGKAIVETTAVDFSDGSGKIWPQASVDLSLPRQSGYVAGEYKLVVRGPSGDVGEPIVITLEGQSATGDGRSGKPARPSQPVWDGGADSPIRPL